MGWPVTRMPFGKHSRIPPVFQRSAWHSQLSQMFNQQDLVTNSQRLDAVLGCLDRSKHPRYAHMISAVVRLPKHLAGWRANKGTNCVQCFCGCFLQGSSDLTVQHSAASWIMISKAWIGFASRSALHHIHRDIYIWLNIPEPHHTLHLAH